MNKKLVFDKQKISHILVIIFFSIICLWTIYPTLKIAIYSYPVQDDFEYAYFVKVLRNENHSLIYACWAKIVDFYYTIVGAYTSSFLGAFFEGIINCERRPLKLFELMSLMFFDGAVGAYCFGIIKKIMKLPIVVVVGVYTVFISLINNVIYYPDSEAHYWLTTSIQYLMILSFVLIGIFAIIMSAYSRSTKTHWEWLIIATVLAFLGAGGNLGLAMLQLCLIIMTYVLIMLTKKHKRSHWAMFVTAMIGTIINGTAPGNFARKGHEITISEVFNSLGLSCKYSFCRIKQMIFVEPLFITIIVVLVVLLIVFRNSIPEITGNYRLPGGVLFLLWLTTVMSIFPAMLGYGYGVYSILMRGNFLSDFMIYNAFIIGILYCAGWIKYRLKLGNIKNIGRIGVIVCLIVIVANSFRLMDNKWKWTPIVRMYRELSSGRMEEYSKNVWAVYDEVKNSEDMEVTIHTKYIEDKTCMIGPYFYYENHDEMVELFADSIVGFYGKKALHLYDEDLE